jgi:(p)ppGpp synthase/HD superfamily hydrolase
MNVSFETFEYALEFAIEKHKGQVRKGNKTPYILHPFSVINKIIENKESKNTYLLGTVAALHDVVEDCGISLKEISEKFGYYVAAMVEELTSDSDKISSMGKANYLLFKMNKMSSYALVIKLCDRLDNVSDLDKVSKKFKEKYIEETNYILNNLDRKLSKTHEKLIRQIRDKINSFTT